MNRSVIGLVMLLCMTTLVARALAQERIPSAQGRIPSVDEFSTGPKSHLEPGVNPSASAGVSQMHVDWDVKVNKRGQSMIEGYVYNSDGVAKNDVQLRVDSLDAGGEPVASQVRAIDGMVPSEGRTYFEFPAPTPASSYQVIIQSAESIEGGSQ